MEETHFFAHLTAVIDHPSDIGEDTKIWHFCHIMKDTHIGKKCVLGQNCFVASGVVIGDYCHLQNNVSIYYGVTLEDHVFVGPSAVFTNDLTPRPFHHKEPDKYPPTLIRKGTSIGANATVVAGVTLGQHSFLGAGSVLLRDLPDYGLAVGNPARLIGYMCSCGARLEIIPKTRELTGRSLLEEPSQESQLPDREGEFTCGKCGAVFHIEKDVLISNKT